MMLEFLSLVTQQNLGGGAPPASDYLVGTVAVDSGTSCTIAPPAGYDTGGLLVAFYLQDARRLITQSSGWTLVEELTNSLGSDRGVHIYARNADGTGDDTLDLTHSSNAGQGFIVSFPTGASLVDSEIQTSGSDSTPPSNSGGLSGASGDYALYCITQQTSVATITGFPTGTDVDTRIGPTANGTESFAAGFEELSGSPGTGDWTMNTADHRYLGGTVVVAL